MKSAASSIAEKLKNKERSILKPFLVFLPRSTHP